MWRALVGLVIAGVLFSACAHHKRPKKTHKHRPLFIKKSKKQRELEAKEARRKALEKFKLIYIYTPVFRFYDYGTIERTEAGGIKVVLYKLSKQIGEIVIQKNYICFSGTCSPKWNAARDMFGQVSYANLFDDIVMGHDIFMGIGKRIEPGGEVIQRFVENGQVIYYERKPGKILFQNMSTGVAVVIEQYHPPAQ